MRITGNLINSHETPPQQLNTRLLTEYNGKGKKGPKPSATAGPHSDIVFKHVSVCVSVGTRGST